MIRPNPVDTDRDFILSFRRGSACIGGSKSLALLFHG
jgi:hypothetical protein